VPLGEVGRRDAEVVRRLALLGELLGVDQHLAAVGDELGEHRVPHVRAVDVAALPRRRDVGRLRVDDLDVVGREAGVLDRGQQRVVRRRRERRRHLPALQAGDVVDAVAHRERLGLADHVVDPRHLVRQVLREAARHRAGAGEADVDAPGRDRLVDGPAGVELLPLDLRVGERRLQPALVLDDQVAVGDRLVGDHDLVGRAARGRGLGAVVVAAAGDGEREQAERQPGTDLHGQGPP
jgi:hypothetical protein